MKILELFKDAGWCVPKTGKIKDFFYNKFVEKGEDEVIKDIYWFGTRGYNQFLDYSLLAIKIANYMNKTHWEHSQDFDFEKIVSDGIISNLLFDDRHDMYQNALYYIHDLIDAFVKEEDKKKFKVYLVNSFIECINVHGTEDVAYKIKLEED